jgi:hypothetical protein
MRASLQRRLDRIEKAMPKPPTAPCPDVVPQIESWLASIGMVRGANESLAEVVARAQGISLQEFQAELRQRAGFTARK